MALQINCAVTCNSMALLWRLFNSSHYSVMSLKYYSIYNSAQSKVLFSFILHIIINYYPNLNLTKTRKENGKKKFIWISSSNNFYWLNLMLLFSLALVLLYSINNFLLFFLLFSLCLSLKKKNDLNSTTITNF